MALQILLLARELVVRSLLGLTFGRLILSIHTYIHTYHWKVPLNQSRQRCPCTCNEADVFFFLSCFSRGAKSDFLEN